MLGYLFNLAAYCSRWIWIWRCTTHTITAWSVQEWMFENLVKGQPGGRIILQHSGNKIQHHSLFLALQAAVTAAPVLGQRTAVLWRVPGGRRRPVPGQAARPVEAGLGAADHVSGNVAEDPAHHGQVLQVVMGLEQCVALKKRKKFEMFILIIKLQCVKKIQPFDLTKFV